MKKIILCLSLVGLISCGGAVVYHNVEKMYPKTEEVDIYTGEMPTKAFKEIGVIEIEDKSCDVEKEAVKKAKEVGAQAIILYSPTVDLNSLSQQIQEAFAKVSPMESESLFFIAVRYTE
jgi:hypothetical protein